MTKRILVLLTILVLIVTAVFAQDVEINATNFPDASFRAWLSNPDNINGYGSDNLLTATEINTITNIDVTFQNIYDLTGIAYFTALTHLVCPFNQLTFLDVSKNTALIHLDCIHNQLTSLDMSKNTALVYLDCTYNFDLAFIDLSNCTALEFLGCFGLYKALTTLDLSNCVALKRLYCNYNYQLTTLDLSNCIALEFLDCSKNYQLVSLDVSNCIALEFLDCSKNYQLVSLDLSNCTALRGLRCDNVNTLTSLDISKNTMLQYLDCIYNQLTSLDLSKNTQIQSVYAYYQSPTLTLSGNNNNYSVAIELNNPRFLVDGISYANGILTSNSTEIKQSDFSVNTGNDFFELSGTLHFTYSEATGISEIQSESITIYPNPVKDVLIIDNRQSKIENVKIYDLSGKIIVNCQLSIVNSINVSALLQGIYFVEIATDKGIVTKKFIKE